MTRMIIDIDILDTRAIISALHAGLIESQISESEYQKLTDIFMDIFANQSIRGNCPECRGNGQLHGDYGQDMDCQTCRANGLPLFINRKDLNK